MGRQGSGEPSTGDVKIKCRRGLREAWHKRMKHGDTKLIVIGIVSGYLIDLVWIVASAHLLQSQFVSLGIAAEHNSYLRPTYTTVLQTLALSALLCQIGT